MRLIGTVGEQAVIAAGNRHAVGAQEQREADPGGGVIAVRDSIPGHHADGDCKGHHEHQRGRPVPRGGAGLIYG